MEEEEGEREWEGTEEGEGEEERRRGREEERKRERDAWARRLLSQVLKPAGGKSSARCISKRSWVFMCVGVMCVGVRSEQDDCCAE